MPWPPSHAAAGGGGPPLGRGGEGRGWSDSGREAAGGASPCSALACARAALRVRLPMGAAQRVGPWIEAGSRIWRAAGAARWCEHTIFLPAVRGALARDESLLAPWPHPHTLHPRRVNCRRSSVGGRRGAARARAARCCGRREWERRQLKQVHKMETHAALSFNAERDATEAAESLTDDGLKRCARRADWRRRRSAAAAPRARLGGTARRRWHPGAGRRRRAPAAAGAGPQSDSPRISRSLAARANALSRTQRREPGGRPGSAAPAPLRLPPPVAPPP